MSEDAKSQTADAAEARSVKKTVAVLSAGVILAITFIFFLADKSSKSEPASRTGKGSNQSQLSSKSSTTSALAAVVLSSNPQIDASGVQFGTDSSLSAVASALNLRFGNPSKYRILICGETHEIADWSNALSIEYSHDQILEVSYNYGGRVASDGSGSPSAPPESFTPTVKAANGVTIGMTVQQAESLDPSLMPEPPGNPGQPDYLISESFGQGKQSKVFFSVPSKTGFVSAIAPTDVISKLSLIGYNC
jgi:hypothetical protein